ncbi:YhgE/Pip-like protein [Paenibacillus sp. DS2015]|uniref:YhgE/Pip domain-containing protein n=1 Tax=Paenibacillus sp. DS2015 TaxID=3373917 RepID=UPI003D1AF721
MKMLKIEWGNLFKNRILLVSLIVMMFIPIMYSGIFLSSAWDPYGKTANFPVAVVDQDIPAEYGDKTLDVGNELVKELQGNDDFEWHFVGQEEATKGLEDGDYYMVITIPEDFSSNASTVMDLEPKQMNLKYEVSPARNYFGNVVASQGGKLPSEHLCSMRS